ncbi:MAG: protein-glutamate O-methyltransferase CheR [Verrucomicrobia bacterium]|nr:protein-glutamate O-methyltransferase CheR [Verrucomicrobiota bacterium]
MLRLGHAPETQLSLRTYRTVADLLYKHSRIYLGNDKQALLTHRLRHRLPQLGLKSYNQYCALLLSRDGMDEIEHLVDFLSTNHTFFFREPEAFSFLTTRILPELIPQLLSSFSPLRIWSAAASSGEEPYTIALALTEALRAFPLLDWKVTASDISHRMLARAQKGIYSMKSVNPVPLDLLRRHFQKGIGIHAGNFRVKAALRQRVLFEHINLFQFPYPFAHEQHVIFCRNVMIYFDQPSRAVLVDKLVQNLTPGGYLILGLSESLFGLHHNLESIQQGVYRRR